MNSAGTKDGHGGRGLRSAVLVLVLAGIGLVPGTLLSAAEPPATPATGSDLSTRAGEWLASSLTSTTAWRRHGAASPTCSRNQVFSAQN